MSVIEGWRPELTRRGQRNLGQHETRTVNRTAVVAKNLAETPPSIDPAGQAVVAATEQGQIILDGAEQTAGAMLPLGGAFTEPPVVGEVH
jgi:hypothetical protein